MKRCNQRSESLNLSLATNPPSSQLRCPPLPDHPVNRTLSHIVPFVSLAFTMSNHLVQVTLYSTFIPFQVGCWQWVWVQAGLWPHCLGWNPCRSLNPICAAGPACRMGPLMCILHSLLWEPRALSQVGPPSLSGTVGATENPSPASRCGCHLAAQDGPLHDAGPRARPGSAAPEQSCGLGEDDFLADGGVFALSHQLMAEAPRCRGSRLGW